MVQTMEGLSSNRSIYVHFLRLVYPKHFVEIGGGNMHHWLRVCMDALGSVIELSGTGRVQPPVHYSTPSLFSKITLGVRINPPEQRSVTQCILLSACIKTFPTRVSFRMIRLSEAMTVLWIIYLYTYLFIYIDVAHADVLFCTSMPYTPLCICVCTVGHARSKA